MTSSIIKIGLENLESEWNFNEDVADILKVKRESKHFRARPADVQTEQKRLSIG